MKVLGYKRKDGTVGIRDHTIVLPLTGCVNETARRIAGEKAVWINHWHGCDMLESDSDYIRLQLEKTCTHPNVGRVILVTMDCAPFNAQKMATMVKDSGRECEIVNIHKFDMEQDAIDWGQLFAGIQSKKPKVIEHPINFAVHCGGTTKDSIEMVNRPLGKLCDKLIEDGNRVMFSEDWEMIEDVDEFKKNLKTERDRLAYFTDRTRMANEYVGRYSGSVWPPKLPKDCTKNRLLKTGSNPIKVRPWTTDFEKEKPGRYYVPGPNSDIASVTQLALAGCQVCLFATGRGTPTGNALIPVFKYGMPGSGYREDIFDIPTEAERTGHREWQYHLKGVIW